MDYINLIQQKMGVTTYMANRRCTFAVLFKTFSLTGAALLLAANVWGFETNESSKVEGDFEVTAALKVGSVDAANSDGIVTESEGLGDGNNNTTLATSAAIVEYVNAVAAAAAAGGGSSAAMGYPTQISNESATAMGLKNAVNACVALQEGGHTDWRIPTVDELINLCHACEGNNYLWTITPTYYTKWVVVKPETAEWEQRDRQAEGDESHFRCVR